MSQSNMKSLMIFAVLSFVLFMAACGEDERMLPLRKVVRISVLNIVKKWIIRLQALSQVLAKLS